MVEHPVSRQSQILFVVFRLAEVAEVGESVKVAVVGGRAERRQRQPQRRRRFGAETHAVGETRRVRRRTGDPSVVRRVTRYARRDLMQLPACACERARVQVCMRVRCVMGSLHHFVI